MRFPKDENRPSLQMEQFILILNLKQLHFYYKNTKPLR